MTVEWCLPPKLRPISGSDAWVSALHRYIAIWRGIATDFELLRDRRSDDLQLVVVGHGLLDHVHRDGALVLADDVLQHFLRQGDRHLPPVSDAYAIRRMSDPSSSRMFDLIFSAM